MRGKKTRNMDSFIFVIHCRIEIYIFHNRINFKLKMMILFMILKQTWTQFSLFFHCGCLGSVLASGADWSVILLCLIIKAFIFIVLISSFVGGGPGLRSLICGERLMTSREYRSFSLWYRHHRPVNPLDRVSLSSPDDGEDG